LLAAVLNGMALEISSLIWTNTLQELVPNEQLGRISSIDMVGTYSLIPIGLALAGWATNALGAATVCLIGGGLTVAVAALGLAHPAIRAVD
jgi:DHA3 family tetracycline resistance protein-like MFS transporter